eukprot:4732679-Amphidinium_carterae.1
MADRCCAMRKTQRNSISGLALGEVKEVLQQQGRAKQGAPGEAQGFAATANSSTLHRTPTGHRQARTVLLSFLQWCCGMRTAVAASAWVDCHCCLRISTSGQSSRFCARLDMHKSSQRKITTRMGIRAL